jgi:prepilin-type N-terminal cleavage/methylation domain-containing protein
MNRVNDRAGFTLIELMLSMAFVSILLLAIAMTVMEMSSIFNKGLTLKEVNQAGRSITTELQSTIAATSLFDIKAGPSSRYISQDWGGRLCVGQYSYIWNNGKALSVGDAARLNIYADSLNAIRFVKVIDPNSSYCTDTTKKIVSADAVELLNASEHNLAIHSFSISTSDSATDLKTEQRLYSIEFTIGTNNQESLENQSGIWQCKAPGQAGADLPYCSISSFNIVALAGNSVK